MAIRVSALVAVRLGNDLRALLRLMSMCVDSLKQRRSPGEAEERDFIELEGALDSAFHISRELVALGQPSPMAPSVVDMNELVAQLEHVLMRVLGPEIRLSLRLEAPDPVVQAQAVQLEWVLLNLAANSRDAMPQGGSFIVQTAAVERRVGTPSRLQRFIRLSVSDTGHGLFGDAWSRASEPFFSTKEGAAGLGLTSVATIVRSFQGWLHIESDRKGTSVHINLPALTPARA
jgi:signal transduction histidine kinase